MQSKQHFDYRGAKYGTIWDKVQQLPLGFNPNHPRPQLNYIDNFQSSVNPANYVSDLGDIFLFNQLLSGNGQGQMTGNKVSCKGIYWYFVTELSTLTETPPSCVIRWMLFWDKQADGKLADITDLLGPESSSVLQDNIAEPPSFMNRERFIVLHDESVALCKNGQDKYVFQGYKEINMESKYDVDNDGFPTTGALVGLIVSDISVLDDPPTPPALNCPIYFGTWRTYYYNN